MHGVRIVPIVGNDGRATVLHLIKASRCIVAVLVKAGQTALNDFLLTIQRPACPHRSQCIFDLEADASTRCEWDRRQR